MGSKAHERSMTGHLIKCLKQYPCLYANKTKEYFDTNKKAAAYATLLAEMKKHEPTIELQQIKTRIKSLRTQYVRELRQQQKIKQVYDSLDSYEPKLWCFKELSFLRQHTTLRSKGTEYKVKKNPRIKKEHPLSKQERVRKLDRTWTKEETERLVEEVKQREELWNPGDIYYGDANKRAESWEDIATVMNLQKYQVVNKWHSLRKSFRTIYKKRQAMNEEDLKPPSDAYCMLAFLGEALFYLESLREETQSEIDYSSDSEVSLQQFPKTEALEYDGTENESVYSMDQSFTDEIQPINESANTKFETIYADEDKNNEQYCNETSVDTVRSLEQKQRDNWTSIADIVAFSGREWQRKNPSLANQFKTILYKSLMEFQVKAAALDELDLQKNS